MFIVAAQGLRPVGLRRYSWWADGWYQFTFGIIYRFEALHGAFAAVNMQTKW